MAKRSKNFLNTQYAHLEPRNLLAGISLEVFNGFDTVLIDGTNVNDVAFVADASGDRIAVTNNDETEFFDRSEIERIRFLGRGGNDQFTNATDISSFAYGHSGNDTLRGGNGNNWIQGGPGNDRLFGGDRNDLIRGNDGNDEIDTGLRHDRAFGNDGDDLLVGSQGRDVLDGGDGEDSIFGGANDDIIRGGTQDDLLDGGEGDDQISGEAGVDQLFGRNGDDQLAGGSENDSIFGNAGEDRLFGESGEDLLEGGFDADEIFGGTGDDTILGGGGVDLVQGNQGSDTIDLGGSSGDVAQFSGRFQDYSLEEQGDSITLLDFRGSGTDVLTGTEFFDFADGRRPAEVLSTSRTVRVQPIIVSNSNGSNTAEYFGNAAQTEEIHRRIDVIFSQAEIDVEWLSPRSWNNTAVNLAQTSFGDIFPLGDNSGVGNSNPLIVDLYFTEVVPQTGSTGENTANGLAFVGGNGIVMHVGDNLVDFSGGREVVASVAAHELAHNLGLEHITTDTDNLLFSPGSGRTGDELTQSQINTIVNSQFAISS